MATGERIEKTLYVWVYHTEEQEFPEECRFGCLYATNDRQARNLVNERIRSWVGPLGEISLQACPDGFFARLELPGKWRVPPDLTWI